MKNKTTQKKKRRKLRLFKRQKGKCYWCKCFLISLQKTQSGGQLPDNYPTLDHLDEKFTGRRGKMTGERTVLACRKCNNSRSEPGRLLFKKRNKNNG